MIKPELLAPAKDLKKAKFAIDYGADAVYIGGKMFSLRSRASNFELEDIKEIVEYAHERNRKVYVTMNIVFHDEDFEGVKEKCSFISPVPKGVGVLTVASLVYKMGKRN